jgi:hypothetical protein
LAAWSKTANPTLCQLAAWSKTANPTLCQLAALSKTSDPNLCKFATLSITADLFIIEVTHYLKFNPLFEIHLPIQTTSLIQPNSVDPKGILLDCFAILAVFTFAIGSVENFVGFVKKTVSKKCLITHKFPEGLAMH